MPEGTNSTQDPATGGDIYRPLEDHAYERRATSERDTIVPASVQHSSSSGSHVGAKVIRWHWWTIALCASILVWLGIARFFDLI